MFQAHLVLSSINPGVSSQIFLQASGFLFKNMLPGENKMQADSRTIVLKQPPHERPRCVDEEAGTQRLGATCSKSHSG